MVRVGDGLLGGVGDGVFGGWCARGIIIFPGVLTKLKFSMKFPHLKFIDLMKELKYEHQSIFPLWGRVKLLGTGSENQIFFLRTPTDVNFFHKIVKKLLWCKKKNHYPPRWIFITLI